jgi:hypothetical protein
MKSIPKGCIGKTEKVNFGVLRILKTRKSREVHLRLFPVPASILALLLAALLPQGWLFVPRRLSTIGGFGCIKAGGDGSQSGNF